MEEKWLGKISFVRFGNGGYQDSQFGVWFEFSGDGLGISDGKGEWSSWSKGCEWTQEERRDGWGRMVEWIKDIMKSAKVDSLDKLKGKPVEITTVDSRLESWRILTEVL
jgi:hypothetical protein